MPAGDRGRLRGASVGDLRQVLPWPSHRAGKEQATVPEKNMSMQHAVAVVIWLLGALAAFGASGVWLVDAQTGKMSAWALVSLAWGAALLALLAHHVSQL